MKGQQFTHECLRGAQSFRLVVHIFIFGLLFLETAKYLGGGFYFCIIETICVDDDTIDIHKKSVLQWRTLKFGHRLACLFLDCIYLHYRRTASLKKSVLHWRT